MDERKLRLGVGVLVVASLGIGIGLTMFFGAFKTLLTKHYTITAQFPAAPGVGFDTPFAKTGCRLKSERHPALGRSARPCAVDDGDRRSLSIRAGEVPRIGTGSLITGDAIVEFVPATEEQLCDSLMDRVRHSMDSHATE